MRISKIKMGQQKLSPLILGCIVEMCVYKKNKSK